MNPKMLEHPATQDNLSTLENRYRYKIIPPETGEVACGDWGAGKMADLDSIMAAVHGQLLTHQILSGKNILVTAGGTREAH